MAEIRLAASAGFCFGVRRAVGMAEEAGGKGPCASLGELIHNHDVVERLEKQGVRTIHSAAETDPGETVIIRSHGAAKAVYDELSARQAEILDATCPMVKRVQEIACGEEAKGRQVLVVGQPDHPEIQALTGWCKSAVVVPSPEKAEKWATQDEKWKSFPLSIVSQTTAERKNFENIVKIIKKLCTNCEIFDTICDATSRRQKETQELSEKCGAVVVIGGRHSANSRNLYEIASRSCPRVQFVENAAELDPDAFLGAELIGVTAGASTPEWIIKEVVNRMSDEIKSAEMAEKVETVVEQVAEKAEEVKETVVEKVEEAVHDAAEKVEETIEKVNAAVEDAKAEAGEKADEAEASFEELLERSIKTLHTGEKVSGVIASITQTEVSVDLGTKQSGYIPISELSDEPNFNVNEHFKVGDEIEAFVTRVNDVEGTVALSKKRLDANKAWETIAEARNEKITVEGTVVEENKGGIVVLVKGVRVFVPASQSGLPKDTPMTELLKQKVKLRITEVNQPRRRVVGSIRAVAYEERRAKAEAVWNEIEIGKHYNGVVKSLTSYGAFVDIGGVDGMVHVSELSWGRIHQPSEVVAVGDEIDVYVINFDKETKKISLGHKDPNANPWTQFTDKYGEGDVAEVKIVKLMTFGAFAEIVPGVDGLIHISQIANRRIGKPEDVLSEGQVVEAKIVGIDNENKKVSLSIRALGEAPAPVKEEKPEIEDDDDEPVVVYDTDNPPAAEDIPGDSEE